MGARGVPRKGYAKKTNDEHDAMVLRELGFFACTFKLRELHERIGRGKITEHELQLALARLRRQGKAFYDRQNGWTRADEIGAP